MKIGYLTRSEKRFMALTLRAIQAGAIAEIDAGLLIGEKVVPSLLALAEAGLNRTSRQQVVQLGAQMYRYTAVMRPLFFLLLAAIYASCLTSAPAAWAQASPAPTSCAATFAKISSAPASGQPALEKLAQYLAKHPELGHRLEYRPNGLPVLEIDYLERSQQKFMTLALRAIREGSLREIDTGTLVGPKALTSILALAESAAERPIKIHGFMMVDLANDVPARAGLHTYADGVTEEWTALEIRQFQNAYARLRFSECEALSYICPFSLNTSRGSLDIQYGNP